MALSVSVSTTLTGGSNISVVLESTNDYQTYYRIQATPNKSNYKGRNYSSVEIARGVAPTGTTHTGGRILDSVLKSWFGDFMGGTVSVTVYYSQNSDMSGGSSITKDVDIYHLIFNDYLAVKLATINDVSANHLFLRDHNSMEITYHIYPVNGTTNITIASTQTTYNLTETTNTFTKFGTEPINCRVTLHSVFSPNAKIASYITYTIPSFGGTSTVTNQFAANISIPIVDYAGPSMYGEITTPVGTEGRCEVSIGGRFQTVVGTIDQIYNNSVTGEYELRYLSSSTVISSGDLTITTGEDGRFTSIINLSGLDYENKYKLIVYVYDIFNVSDRVELNLVSIPMFDWCYNDFNFNVPVFHQENLNMIEGKTIAGVSATYGTKPVFTPLDSSGNTVIGYDHYAKEFGNTLIYGDKVEIMAHEGVTVNGESISNPEWKTLWTGTSLMGDGSYATLSTPIADLKYGIHLVFSGVSEAGVYQNSSFNTFYLSKRAVESLISSGGGHTFLMGINAGFSVVGAKYLYFSDDSIMGHSGNTQSGTGASGITFNNNRFGLRAVYGL